MKTTRKRFSTLSVLTLLLIAVAHTTQAAVAVNPFAVDGSGAITISGDVTARVNFFDKGWARTIQGADTITANSGFPKTDAGKWELEGQFHVKTVSEPFAITEKVTMDADKARYECTVTAGTDTEMNTLAVVLQFPVAKFKGKKIIMDGKELVLPDQFSGSQDIALEDGVSTVTVSMPGDKKLKITGPLDLYLQDDRRFHGTAYTMRLFFKPKNGLLKKGDTSSIAVTFEQSSN